MPRDIPQGWRILEIGARDDYFEFWNDIRQQGPVLDAGDGVFLVTEWALARDGLRHPSLHAGQGVAAAFGLESPVETVVRNWLMSLNGDRHRRARGLVSRVFTPRSLTTLEPTIRGVARELASGFVEQSHTKPTDFVGWMAAKLPCEVIRVLFAIEPAEWAQCVEPLFLSDTVHQQDAFAAVAGLTHYFGKAIGEAGKRKTGGVIDLLIAPGDDGDRLTQAEIVANCVLIVTAAIDTTAGLIANTLLRLVEHPAAMKRSAANPALLPAVIEESLRHCPSAPSSTRLAMAALQLGETLIPEGSNIFFSFSAANRDPKKFIDPDRFDIDRDNSGLLTFGGGAHFCLGAGLARMEARLVFEELFAIAGDFTLAEPVRWRVNNPVVRAPEHLMISCVSRDAQV